MWFPHSPLTISDQKGGIDGKESEEMRIDSICVNVHVSCHPCGRVSFAVSHSHKIHPLLQAALCGYVLVDPEKLSKRMWIYQRVKIYYNY